VNDQPTRMTPKGKELSDQYRTRRKVSARQPVLNVVVLVSLALLLAFAGWAIGDLMATARANDDQDTAISRINQKLLTVCQKVPAGQLSPNEKDGCVQASQSPAVAEAPEVTDARIRTLVRGVLAETPPIPGPAGRDAPAVDVDAVVTRVRALIPTPANGQPGQDAPDPSDARLTGLIRTVLAENPPKDGKDGESPPCLSEPRQCRGDDGVPGAAGAEGPTGPAGASCPEGYAFAPGPKLLPTEPDTMICTATG